jgi:hypothetical protein
MHIQQVKLEALRKEFDRSEEDIKKLVELFGYHIPRIRLCLQVEEHEKKRIKPTENVPA